MKVFDTSYDAWGKQHDAGSFEGKNIWKAGALSLLSSAVSYGIGEAFKGATMTFGNELLRAGAHGLASGVVSALDNKQEMLEEIYRQGPSKVSKHCSDFRQLNVIDIAPSSVSDKVAFHRAFFNNKKISRVLDL